MAAPTFVASSQVMNSCKFTPASNWASPGSIISGDVIVALLVGSELTSPPGTVTPPTGFTLRASTTGTTNLWAYVYTKVLTGSEPAEYVFLLTSAAGAANAVTARVFMAVYHNVDTTTPVEAVGTFLANAGASTSSIAPAVTTLSANAMVVGMWRVGGQFAITSNVSGLTEREDAVFDSVQTDFSAALADQVQAAAGSSGTRTATHTSTTNRVGVLIALKPSGGTPVFVTSGKGAGDDGYGVAIAHSQTFARPTGATTDDYLLVALVSNGGLTISGVPSGFTLLVQFNTPATLSRAIYYKRLGASEPDYYTFTVSKTSSTFTGAAAAFRGAGADVLIAGAYSDVVTGSSSTTTTATGITVITADTLVVGFFFGGSTLRTFTAPGGGWTEHHDVGGVEVVSLAFGSPGATGDISATADTAASTTNRASVLVGIPSSSTPVTGLPKTTKQMLLGVG